MIWTSVASGEWEMERRTGNGTNMAISTSQELQYYSLESPRNNPHKLSANANALDLLPISVPRLAAAAPAELRACEEIQCSVILPIVMRTSIYVFHTRTQRESAKAISATSMTIEARKPEIRPGSRQTPQSFTANPFNTDTTSLRSAAGPVGVASLVTKDCALRFVQISQ
jgi:hypothetical protein